MLVNICSYSIHITIETFTNPKQIIEKNPLEKTSRLKFENSVLTKRNQTKMLHKQKGYTSPVLHKFTLINLINEKYLYIFAKTYHNKSTSTVLFLIT